jgi:hypothetical protein
MGEVVVHGCPDELLDVFWDAAGEYLQPALDHGDNLYDLEDLHTKCLSGDMQLWVAYDKGLLAAVVTQITVYPNARVLELQFCGGTRMNEWLSSMMSTLEAFAREQQCDRVYVVGRKGWMRALREYEYMNTVLRKVL